MKKRKKKLMFSLIQGAMRISVKKTTGRSMRR
jgi:hypothetical protein